MIIRLQGIVLKNKAYGESDQILSIFSPIFGKSTIIVRGSKKPRSRFGTVTEPFTIANFICYQYSPTSMPTLSQADIIKHNKSIRADLLLTAYGAYWAELVNGVITEKEPQAVLYEQFVLLLDQLDMGKDPEILSRLMELAILKVAGYQPVFDHCVQCKRTVHPVSFSISQGGFLCADCNRAEAIPLSQAAAFYLKVLNNLNIGQLGKVNIKSETKQELESILTQYMDTHLEIPLKSRSILQQLKKVWDV